MIVIIIINEKKLLIIELTGEHYVCGLVRSDSIGI